MVTLGHDFIIFLNYLYASNSKVATIAFIWLVIVVSFYYISRYFMERPGIGRKWAVWRFLAFEIRFRRKTLFDEGRIKIKLDQLKTEFLPSVLLSITCNIRNYIFKIIFRVHLKLWLIELDELEKNKDVRHYESARLRKYILDMINQVEEKISLGAHKYQIPIEIVSYYHAKKEKHKNQLLSSVDVICGLDGIRNDERLEYIFEHINRYMECILRELAMVAMAKDIPYDKLECLFDGCVICRLNKCAFGQQPGTRPNCTRMPMPLPDESDSLHSTMFLEHWRD